MWMFCLPKGTPIKVAHEPACLTCHAELHFLLNVNCNARHPALQGRLFFWSYLYYLSKFYEFIDTVLLVLKVSFLASLQRDHCLYRFCMHCSCTFTLSTGITACRLKDWRMFCC